MSRTSEASESLWALGLAPLIWAGYFLLSYATAAVWCARMAAAGGDLGGGRIVIATYTAVALVLIALCAHRGFRRHTYGEAAAPPHDRDSDESRHRFLGFASLLLSGLAAVATIYVALPLVLAPGCR